MQASQFAFPITIRYFRFLAVYLILANIAKWSVSYLLFRQITLNGVSMSYLLHHKLFECFIQILMSAPIIIVTLRYKRKGKDENCQHSMQLFNFAAFAIIISCAASVITAAATVSDNVGNLLLVICAAFCMYLSGTLLYDRKIKLCAIWFSAACALILTAAGFTLSFVSYSDPALFLNSYHLICAACSYAMGAVYYLFVPTGFFVLSVMLSRIKKQGEMK